ncbi:hypothetical protein GCM10010400_01620 [Streptomyces aculeolatus]
MPVGPEAEAHDVAKPSERRLVHDTGRPGTPHLRRGCRPVEVPYLTYPAGQDHDPLAFGPAAAQQTIFVVARAASADEDRAGNPWSKRSLSEVSGWGGWDSNPRPTDYESATPRAASHRGLPARPVSGPVWMTVDDPVPPVSPGW